MSRDYIRMRATGDRERRLERAKDALARIGEDVDQDSTTIDIALSALPQLVELIEEQQAEMQADAKAVSGDAIVLSAYPTIKLRKDAR